MCHLTNEFRKDLLRQKIKFFNDRNIDIILTSSDHMEKFDGIKNYITIDHVSESKYLTEGFFPSINFSENVFFRGYSHTRKINHLNYFIIAHKTLYSYCLNLGYEFCYLIYLDFVLNAEYFDNFSKEIDYSKIYFYTFDKKNILNDMFLCGNLKVLSNGFSDEKLNYIEKFSKESIILTTEVALYLLFYNNKDLIIKTDSDQVVFDKSNIFSSNNSAEIYHDALSDSYTFLCYKGDSFKNKFACELYENEVLIYSGKFVENNVFYILNLNSNKIYTIKYYDDDTIDDYFLSKVSKIYTGKTEDSSLKCINWIHKNNLS